MSKVHFDAEPDSPIPRAICGWLGGTVTGVADAVTCKRCKKRLRRVKAAAALTGQDTIKPVADPAERYVERVERGIPHPTWDDVEGLPVLTPDTYRRRDCTCRDCSVCRFFRRIEQDEYAAPWRKTHVVYDPHRPRWSSVAAALETLVIARVDGSSAGGWGYSLDVFRRLGVRIQAGGPTDSAAERQADDAIEVERALAAAYDQHNDRGLGLARCCAILLARLVGRLETIEGRGGRRAQRRVPVPIPELAEELGVSPSVIGGIVKSGKQRVYEHLRARGLVEQRRRAA